eukprot:NODE_846_length_3739_cov_0.148626.p1 type:complete len:395 gc:universal NODE_846_length_3739_cov_0.148626:1335-2519(+)
MDLLTVNVIFQGYPTKSFYFYQQNTLQQAKEMVLAAHEGLPADVYNFGFFQPLQSNSEDGKVQGKFLEEQKTFAAYRLYGTISLSFILKHKIGCSNKKVGKIFQYVEEKKIEKLKELLEDNDPNVADANGNTPLQYAAIQNDRFLMQTLVENGAFIDFRGKNLRTPLHSAVINDKYIATHFLVMLGHILDCKDDKGLTPLYYAVTGGFVALTRYLLQSGSREIEQPDLNGKTLLMNAISKGSPVMVSDLLQYGANVQAATEAGQSCLHLSISLGTDETTRILLQNGANRQAKNKQGQIPSHVAMILGNSNMYKLLESYDNSNIHLTAHPCGIYPFEMPVENNSSATIKKDRVGALKMKVTRSDSTNQRRVKQSSPDTSVYSVDSGVNEPKVFSI